MKKILPAILGILLILSLCACSTEPGATRAVTVSKHGGDYVIDPSSGTIFDGTHTYQYDLTTGSNSSSITITYPDGSIYWWKTQRSNGITTGYVGWSDDYDENRYVDGETLCDIFEEDIPRKTSAAIAPWVFLLIAFGLLCIAWPHGIWFLTYGWLFKNAEPSDLILGLTRFVGIIAVILAIILAFA